MQEMDINLNTNKYPMQGTIQCLNFVNEETEDNVTCSVSHK